jgi:TctA family transporter
MCLLCHAAHLYVDLGSAIVDSGAVALLVVCLQEPDVALKRACALALAEIANFAVDVCVCSSRMVALLVIFCSGAFGWFLLLHDIACCCVLCP